MSASLRTVSVFIASPGDVADSRETVRHAIERVNRLVARPNGILFEPIGWEDIPAGKSLRAQDLINPFVDVADLFIGLLGRRFGTPNGIAESGTHEEYQRAAARWHSQSPKPDIKVYFRRLTQEDLRQPNEQLQNVLRFKEEIATTDLFHEFNDDHELEQRIENDLAAWVYDHLERESVLSPYVVHGVSDADVSVLATTLDGTSPVDSPERQRLLRAGLLRSSGESYALANSTDGFVAIAKHLNVVQYHREFLQSRYFSAMMQAHLKSVVQARYHVTLADNAVEALRRLAILSPSVASYLLTGDTSLYDNLFEHANKIGNHEYANTMLEQSLVHHTLVAYATDSTNGVLLDAVDGKAVAGQAVGVNVRTVFEGGGSLNLSSMVPSVRAELEQSSVIEKGQMVSATSPEFFVHNGTVLLQLGLFDHAARAFKTALEHDLLAEGRAAALNNLGLALVNSGDKEGARKYFQEAADLNLGSAEIMNNLALLGPNQS